MRERPNLKDYSIETLRERLARDGLEPYRAEQIAHWLYRRGVDDPSQMTDLGLDLRERLGREWATRALEITGVDRSADGTLKAILRASDGAEIESVLIPEEGRTTLCVSTQVGCSLACSFCATGALGFRRNLSTAEIADQVCRMGDLLGGERRVTNVVFMGMGEPLLNLRAVIEAVRILVHPKAMAMAPRRVTVSTVGVIPGIRPLLETAPVNLAVSLHATTDEVRDRLVPLNRRFPLAKLLGALRDLECVGPRRPVFFEYTLIAGVNDGLDDARRLVALLGSIPSKVNLIRMNPHAGCEFRPPAEEVVDRFLRELAALGATVTLRRSRGSDIHAACGQLALRRAGDAERRSRGCAEPSRPAPGVPDQGAAFAGRKAIGRP
jgi:23S rRNA (adenine2503-C2)-methyltransferase